MTKTAFVNCNLFVGNEDNLVDNAWFVVDDETGKLTDQGKGKCSADFDKKVDLKGQYVMSGLLNSHTHMGLDSDLKKNFRLLKLRLLMQHCGICVKLYKLV